MTRDYMAARGSAAGSRLALAECVLVFCAARDVRDIFFAGH
jgi:hypothetical protein